MRDLRAGNLLRYCTSRTTNGTQSTIFTVRTCLSIVVESFESKRLTNLRILLEVRYNVSNRCNRLEGIQLLQTNAHAARVCLSEWRKSMMRSVSSGGTLVMVVVMKESMESDNHFMMLSSSQRRRVKAQQVLNEN